MLLRVDTLTDRRPATRRDLSVESPLRIAADEYMKRMWRIVSRTESLVPTGVLYLKTPLPTLDEFRDELRDAIVDDPELSPRRAFLRVNQDLDIDGWTFDADVIDDALRGYPLVVSTVCVGEHVVVLAFTRTGTWIFDIAGMHDLRTVPKSDGLRNLVEKIIGRSVDDADVKNMPERGTEVSYDDFLSSPPVIYDGVRLLNIVNLQEWQGPNDDMCLIWCTMFTWTLFVGRCVESTDVDQSIYECWCIFREHVVVKTWLKVGEVGEVAIRRKNLVYAFDIVAFGRMSPHTRSFEWTYLEADEIIGDFFCDVADGREYDFSGIRYRYIVPFHSNASFQSLADAAAASAAAQA